MLIEKILCNQFANNGVVLCVECMESTDSSEYACADLLEFGVHWREKFLLYICTQKHMHVFLSTDYFESKYIISNICIS